MTDLVTSGVYLAPTASLLWNLSGTRRASENGKRRRIRRVASSRRAKSVRTLDHRKDGILKGAGKHLAEVAAAVVGACTTLRWPPRLRNLS
jgi:hypothetical protein